MHPPKKAMTAQDYQVKSLSEALKQPVQLVSVRTSNQDKLDGHKAESARLKLVEEQMDLADVLAEKLENAEAKMAEYTSEGKTVPPHRIKITALVRAQLEDLMKSLETPGGAAKSVIDLDEAAGEAGGPAGEVGAEEAASEASSDEDDLVEDVGQTQETQERQR